MSAQGQSDKLLVQNPTHPESRLCRELAADLATPTVKGVRIIMSYVTWGGLSIIAQALEDFLSRGKSVETVFGTGNSVTTPDALLYSYYLKTRFPSYKAAIAIEWNYQNSSFHSKCIAFDYPNSVTIVAGSSNLTGGGLAYNHEVCLSVTSPAGSQIVADLNEWWQACISMGVPITPKLVQDLRKRHKLGSEKQGEVKGEQEVVNLPKEPSRPFFRHVLAGREKVKVRHRMMAESSEITEKPRSLYLQILNETGGGHQVQLPVATLGAFFGVAKGEAKDVNFNFGQFNADVDVSLTHFSNNTHRVRLLPLKRVQRPAIVLFERTGQDNEYECTVISPSEYRKVLEAKCQERTRKGSRRWGFED